MPPIRIGFIGLPSTGAGWAALSHWSYLKQSSKFQVVALCNSSKESAQKAIQKFGLPAETKAYGSPEELAKDEAVQLVVCSTRVDTHYDLVKPSLQRGKDVFCEWPLTSSTETARELHELAKAKGSNLFVGLQGVQSPITLKLKELVDSQQWGKVLSSTFIGYTGSGPRNVSPVKLKYSYERKIGGNYVTIFLGHSIAFLHRVLGEFAPSTISSRLDLLRPNVKLTDSDGNVVETVRSNVPDQLVVNGQTEAGSALSIFLSKGIAFKSTEALDWRIYLEKGEIRLSGSTAMFSAFGGEWKIQVQDYETDSVEDVSWRTPFEELPAPSRNVGLLYEAYAAGNKNGYVGSEQAVNYHEEIDRIWQGFAQ